MSVSKTEIEFAETNLIPKKMCDSIDLSREESEKCIPKERITFSQRFYRIMSSKKINALSDKIREELGLSNVSQNRKSFSDRICDDLCEEILQYLSLEDKLKLEGVSKQFQRTVLKKHYELTIETLNWMDNRIVKEENKYLFIENMFIDLNSLEILLKKCPNITSINLRKSEDEFNYNPVFRLIIKYCNNLREICFKEIEISDENIEEFQRKFGPKTNFIHRLKDANNYNLFPNIQKLFIDENDLVEVILRLKLKKLTNLELELHFERQDMVETCVLTFPTLRRLYLDIYSDSEEILTQNENAIYKSLDFISNLKHLIDLSFEAFDVNNKLFCDSLKRMANKSQKLKRFAVNLYMTENSDIRLILSSIKAFPALKRLCFRLYTIDNNIVFSDKFTFELFKGLSNLSHLTLCFNYSDYFLIELKDIDINLPNLQYLVLENMINLNGEEVTQMADILSRLSKLKTIKLQMDSELNDNEIEVIFRQKCRKLRTFEINYKL